MKDLEGFSQVGIDSLLQHPHEAVHCQVLTLLLGELVLHLTPEEPLELVVKHSLHNHIEQEKLRMISVFLRNGVEDIVVSVDSLENREGNFVRVDCLVLELPLENLEGKVDSSQPSEK